jgi:G3E family GTPase
MAVPILLVTGFLGAGKTSLINRLLAEPGGRRIAAIVNDFGAIDIDAALLGAVTDGVVSLKNGCICCTLQGDLMRTLHNVMARQPAPDAIVIETSGVSDPAEIVRALLDPVIFKAAALDTVVCLVDAAHVHDAAAMRDDPLWRAQLRAADFLVLNKADLIDKAGRLALREAIGCWKPAHAIVEAVQGAVPPELLFRAAAYAPAPASLKRSTDAAPRFDTLSWSAPAPLSLGRFQNVIGMLAPKLIRAKGIVTFAETPREPMLFQLVGARATITASPVPPGAGLAAELVLIAESGLLDPAIVTPLLATMQVAPG